MCLVSSHLWRRVLRSCGQRLAAVVQVHHLGHCWKLVAGGLVDWAGQDPGMGRTGHADGLAELFEACQVLVTVISKTLVERIGARRRARKRV
jgi:hypothetical protein